MRPGALLSHRSPLLLAGSGRMYACMNEYLDLPQMEFKTRAELRRWLEAQHDIDGYMSSICYDSMYK